VLYRKEILIPNNPKVLDEVYAAKFDADVQKWHLGEIYEEWVAKQESLEKQMEHLRTLEELLAKGSLNSNPGLVFTIFKELDSDIFETCPDTQLLSKRIAHIWQLSMSAPEFTQNNPYLQ